MKKKRIIPQFQIWKTIQIDPALRTADDFRLAILARGMKISKKANDMLENISFVENIEQREIDLVKTNNADLGFEKGARRPDMYNRAEEFGLKRILPQIGLHLRLQYIDQTKKERAIISQDPVLHQDWFLHMLCVACINSELWVTSHIDYAGRLWTIDYPLIFELPRANSLSISQR